MFNDDPMFSVDTGFGSYTFPMGNPAGGSYGTNQMGVGVGFEPGFGPTGYSVDTGFGGYGFNPGQHGSYSVPTGFGSSYGFTPGRPGGSFTYGVGGMGARSEGDIPIENSGSDNPTFTEMINQKYGPVSRGMMRVPDYPWLQRPISQGQSLPSQQNQPPQSAPPTPHYTAGKYFKMDAHDPNAVPNNLDRGGYQPTDNREGFPPTTWNEGQDPPPVLHRFDPSQRDWYSVPPGTPQGYPENSPVQSGDYTGNIRGQSQYAKGFLPQDGMKMGSGEYPSLQGHPGITQGNIDLRNRPVIEFSHGLDDSNSSPAGRQQFPHYADDPRTYGSEYSTAFDDGKNAVSIPTIYDGKLHSTAEAEQHYRDTGEYLAKGPRGDYETLGGYESAVHNRPLTVNGQPYHGPNDFTHPNVSSDPTSPDFLNPAMADLHKPKETIRTMRGNETVDPRARAQAEMRYTADARGYGQPSGRDRALQMPIPNIQDLQRAYFQKALGKLIGAY